LFKTNAQTIERDKNKWKSENKVYYGKRIDLSLSRDDQFSWKLIVQFDINNLERSKNRRNSLVCKI